MPGVPYLLYRKEFMKMSDNNNNAKTMYEAVPAAAELNKVPGFDPLKFLRRAGDSMKLDLPYQKLWFRMAHPNGRMRLTAMRITEQMAIFEAKVFLDRSDAEPFSVSVAQQTIHSYLDLYRLDQHRDEIIRMEGFGVKSWQRLWDAVQQSRNTTFERYVIAMDIPMIGNTASGVLCREFHGSLEEFRDAVYTGYDFRQLPDFGETLHNNIHEWFCNEENFCIWEELQMMMNIQKPAAANNQAVGQDTPFAGKNIVVTGKVEPYTRDEMNSLIASLGAVAGSSVSRKTDYLVCGEKAGSKLSKAQELGIRVLTPNEFFNMAGVA